MNREEAIKLLAGQRHAIPDGQEYSAGYFEPSDGPGVARLFYAVYGDGYPIDTYYIPERLAEENRRRNIHSVVARAASGDVVSHVALYRGAAPNPNLYEYGVGLTLPGYRSTLAFFRTNELLLKLAGREGIDGFFGEAVCNHVTTQKLSRHARALETAVEPALMPAEAYEAEQSAAGRVGCLVFFRVDRDGHRPLYLPAPYVNEVKWILDGLNLDRELLAPHADLPDTGAEMEVKRFDYAGVARCSITAPGKDLADRLDALERELREDGYALCQFFIDLGKPWSGGAVELLRKHGCTLGGLLPIWFGDDGLLMQKHFVGPDFDGMKIHSARGRDLVEMIRKDWELSEPYGRR